MFCETMQTYFELFKQIFFESYKIYFSLLYYDDYVYEVSTTHLPPENIQILIRRYIY